MLATLVNQFKDQGFVVVPNVITKDVAALAAQYTLFDAKQHFSVEPGGMAQVPGTHSKYADPLMESFLIFLLPTVEAVTGLRLLPTYSYYRLYKPGDSLKPHTDREACEVTVSINFGYNYEGVNSNYRWPIFVEGNGVLQEAGDMVVFRGPKLEHWRDPFQATGGSWQSQAFLHYVDADGPYKDLIFDTRPELGVVRK